MKRRSLLLAASAVGVPALQRSAFAADTWPARALRWVVPFPAGSSPDAIARLIAQPLAAELGQPIVIDNKPGAGGNLGTGVAARAEPDGYTWLFTIQGPLVTAPLLSRQLGYDPAKDLAPVTLVATSPNLLVVNPGLGAASVTDFVRVARERRGALNYGSVGMGSASHLAMELFKSRAGVDLLHVPYQGFPQVVNAMLAGEVQASFMVPAIAMGQVRSGKLRALAVSTLGRSAALPELPTLAEQGFPGFEAISWQAVLAPARTPAGLIQRMNEALVRVIRSDAVRTAMLAQYFTAAGTAAQALSNLMRSEREVWSRVIRSAGVQPE
ncbi:MAG TPA: tripartite tricarboxylate transporter substrate binding protein [Burkholderiaceae bacterium]|jgi:tripartite-type tricarboxylate transporter receptor subunit TctC|nr:tripartite tricarboxylate transporter substrate binding protein [Burkholderiaceae bacterium]